MFYQQSLYVHKDIIWYIFKHYVQQELVKDLMFKGTLSVILNDPTFKDGNARFTTVPLKALSDQV